MTEDVNRDEMEAVISDTLLLLVMTQRNQNKIMADFLFGLGNQFDMMEGEGADELATALAAFGDDIQKRDKVVGDVLEELEAIFPIKHSLKEDVVARFIAGVRASNKVYENMSDADIKKAAGIHELT